MSNFISKNWKMVSIGLMIVALLTAIPLKTTHAVENPATVPVGTGEDPNSIMTYLKNFTLDHLASLVAKQLLHEMTIQVVNWINTGFHGSPQFVTNPDSFFLDVADQVSGAFLAGSGPLQGLCSPFSLDIRLNLMLSQAQLVNQRYTCTLSTIIKNAQNAHVNVNARVGTSPNGLTAQDFANGNVLKDSNAISVNGASIDATAAFMSGDFGQGGWPAYIAMTTQPQNSEIGAYMTARSDLQNAIASKQSQVNNDLNRGHGFLSWQSCDTLATINSNSTSDDQARADDLTHDPSVSSKVNQDGSVTYQRCTSQTPGSVLAGTLQKNVDSGATQLELANDINAVVNALASQLINTMITAGLGTLSANAGGHISFTAQAEAAQVQIYNQEVSQVQQQAQASLGFSESNATQYKADYDQAVATLTASRNNLLAAKNCFFEKIASGQADSSLTSEQVAYGNSTQSKIDETIASLDTVLATYTSKQSDAGKALAQIRNLQNGSTAQITTQQDVTKQTQNYQNAIQTATSLNNSLNLTTAKSDLDDAQKQAQAFNSTATQYQNACTLFPDSFSSTL